MEQLLPTMPVKMIYFASGNTMKNLKIGLLAIAMICLVAACKKPGNKNAAAASWQFTLDTTEFSGSYSNVTYSSTDKNLVINLGKSAGSYPNLMLQALGPNGNLDILAGTYYFGVTPGYVLQCDSTAALTFAIQPGNGFGQFNITTFDLTNKLVSGTFYFTAPQSPTGTDTMICTNGIINNLPIDVTY